MLALAMVATSASAAACLLAVSPLVKCKRFTPEFANNWDRFAAGAKVGISNSILPGTATERRETNSNGSTSPAMEPMGAATAAGGEREIGAVVEATQTSSVFDLQNPAWPNALVYLEDHEINSHGRCARDRAGDLVGCEQAECNCGWAHWCYPRYMALSKVNEQEETRVVPAINVGVCGFSIPVLAALSGTIVILLFFVVIIVRMYIQYTESIADDTVLFPPRTDVRAETTSRTSPGVGFATRGTAGGRWQPSTRTTGS